METDIRKVDALILAGGQNRRMQGRYKGDLVLHEETFADHLIREMGRIAQHIYLSYGEAEHGNKAGCTIVRDIHPGCGPIAGLEAGLAACREEYLLVAACDMPYLRAEFYRMLLACGDEEARRKGAFPECIVPTLDGLPDNLAAVYSKSMLPLIRELIAAEKYRPRLAIERSRNLFVPLDDRPEYSRMLRNINTGEEYRELLRAEAEHQGKQTDTDRQ